MNLVRLTTIAVSIGFLICSVSAQRVVLPLNKRLSESVTVYDLKASNIHLALSHLASDFGFPIGLEVARTDDLSARDRQLNRRFEGVVLRDVLQEIVVFYGYTWIERDGVINVIPAPNARDNVVVDLLDTRLEVFSVSKSTSILGFRQSISKTPSVSKFFRENSIDYSGQLFPGDFASLGFNENIAFRSKTIRAILNDLCSKQASNYWIVDRFGENRRCLVLNF